MDLEAFQRLLTPAGQAALADAVAMHPSEAGFLQCLARLSKSHPPELARPALEIAILRLEAEAKFPHPEQLYFTRPALEQSSSHAVAAYRAQRFAGFAHILDLGCSVGGDTLSLAQAAPVLGVDLDPVRLAMARLNLAAAAPPFPADFIQADLTAALPVRLAPHMAVFFDPARRTGQRRAFSVRHYHPPLDVIRQWVPQAPALAVKISPGVDLDELRSYDCSIEFISLHGELKEALLCFGPLGGFGRRATLLPGPHILEAGPEPEPPARLSPPLAYIYEPDPAILRAGLVRSLGRRLNAAQLDPDIAYLTAAAHTPTPFARAWPVEAWFPFNLKRLRSELRLRHVGRVTVKKRASPITPEQLIKDLRLKPHEDPHERILFLTHLEGQPIVILGGPQEGSA